jgi:hypothetical protein
MNLARLRPTEKLNLGHSHALMPPPGRIVLWRRQSGVRTKIGLAFSPLAALLFSTTGLMSTQEARRRSEPQTAAMVQQLAERLAQRLDANTWPGATAMWCNWWPRGPSWRPTLMPNVGDSCSPNWRPP